MTLTNSYQYIGRSNAVFNYGSTYYYYLLLYAKTEGNTSTGKHKVSLKMRIACQAGNGFYGYNTTGYAKVAGTSAINWSAQPVPNGAWTTGNLTEDGVTYSRWVDLKEGSTEVNTGFGATKDVKLEASFQRLDMASPPAFVPQTTPMTLSATVTLPALAGASVPTVSESSVAMGSAVTIHTNRKSSSFTHKLTYAFGSATGTIAENVGDSFAWTPPLELASQIPNATSGKGTITCTTYNGSSPVGSAGVDITLTVPDNASTKPTVTMTLAPLSSLGSAFSGLYIQNLTKLQATVTASGKYGASISQKAVSVGGSAYSGGVLTQTGSVSVVGSAKDSRGFLGTTSQSINIIPYSKPTIVPASGKSDIVCARCDKNGSLTASGTYLRIIAQRSYSTITASGVQKNFCYIRYRVNGGSWVTILAKNAASNEVDTGAISGVNLALTSAYSVDVGVADDIGNTHTVTKAISTDKVDVHLREGGGGFALGKYSGEAGFECAMDAYFSGQTYRVADDGVKEYFFPPMVPGNIYRTAERFLGKPVYTACVYIESLPNTRAETVAYMLGVYAERVISIEGTYGSFSTDNNGVYNNEYALVPGNGIKYALVAQRHNGTHFEIKTDSDMSKYSAYITIKFIR